MSRPFVVPIMIMDYGIQYLEILPDENTAVGEESDILMESFENFKQHFLDPVTRQWAEPETRFLQLKQEWEEATAALSSITEICMHPAYQQIIGMGPIAIPFIIREMGNRPNHWFWALKAITGEDPVPPDKRGRIIDMTNAWLLWWEEHKHKK